METFDYIVVGGGSAGCVVAARLSEEAGIRVLLLEAGGRDWNPLVHIPMGSGKLIDRPQGWRYKTDPMPAVDGRKIDWPRGKVLGGSSSINGMVYIRGNASDYDRWAQLGNRGWSYEQVLPYFKRAENHVDRGENRFHGSGGPLTVTRGGWQSPLFDAFVKAGQQAGFPVNDDFNGARQEGFGRFDFTIHKGRRRSASVSYLWSAMARPNLSVVTSAHASRVIVEDGVATGIEYRVGGRDVQARARAEVILCGGAIGSPQVLMLSGIGPAEHLQKMGIEVVHDLPGVGENLQDHPGLSLLFACPLPITAHQLTRADRAAWLLLQAWLFRSGPFGHFPFQGGAFTKTQDNLVEPDVQWHFANTLGDARVRGFTPWQGPGPLQRDGFTINVSLLTPESRGYIRLKSRDPQVNPALQPNFMATPHDLQRMRAAFRQARLVSQQAALAPYISLELAPGPQCQTDDEIDAFIRSAVNTIHHQSGTCKMGSDAMSVVDDELRVRGVGRLRVADASIMPVLVSGNTNAPTIMIAERLVDFVRASRHQAERAA